MLKKWIIAVLIGGPILLAFAHLFALWWLKLVTGTIFLGTGLTVYVLALKNDWRVKPRNGNEP